MLITIFMILTAGLFALFTVETAHWVRVYMILRPYERGTARLALSKVRFGLFNMLVMALAAWWLINW